mgnify:FL=1
MKVFHFDTVSSTNDLARDAQFGHGDIIVAERQTAGRGHRGRSWHSAEGQNLTFTLVVEPHFLAARDQFFLSEAVALALCDCMARYGIEARIKWTNDIYVEDRKLVGILIEHFYAGASLRRTVIGIGLNVNQTHFDPSLPNPTSMQLERGNTFDREEVLRNFQTAFQGRYDQLQAGKWEALQSDYRARMYRLGKAQLFRLPDGEALSAVIEGVEPDGALILRHEGGERHTYRFKEIEFVIKSKKMDKDG